MVVQNTSARSPVGTPGWFTYVAVGQDQALSYAAIGRNSIQDATPAFTRRVEDHAGVRGEARGLVQRARGEGRPARRTHAAVHHRHPVGVARALGHGDLLAVPGNAGVGVVAAFEGDPAGAATGRRRLVDLRTAAPIGGEIDAVAVGAPDRCGIDAELVGDLGQRLAAQVHYV